MVEKWNGSSPTGEGVNVTDVATRLREEIRLRDQSGDVDLIADVSVNPKAVIYTQLSLEPEIRYRDPRTRGNRKPGLANMLKGILQASADFKFDQGRDIEDVMVGAIYSGQEIGLSTGQYLELTRFNEMPTVVFRGRAISQGQSRLDYYIPVVAIKGFSLRVVPQGK
jgi:hypothetical protein